MEKQVYDVQIGETIVVSDLAQKMAVKAREVIKTLMKMGEMVRESQSIDQATAALIKDLKQRGLLDDTLIVWGGEFGRTIYSQGTLTETNYGRDHHPRCYSLFLAGAGVKKGHIHGETDDYSYNIVSDPVPIYDLQATILHLLGIDHKRLTYRFQGRDFRLTDVHGELVEKILA